MAEIIVFGCLNLVVLVAAWYMVDMEKRRAAAVARNQGNAIVDLMDEIEGLNESLDAAFAAIKKLQGGRPQSKQEAVTVAAEAPRPKQ